jgi:hypothetical protein
VGRGGADVNELPPVLDLAAAASTVLIHVADRPQTDGHLLVLSQRIDGSTDRRTDGTTEQRPREKSSEPVH